MAPCVAAPGQARQRATLGFKMNIVMIFSRAVGHVQSLSSDSMPSRFLRCWRRWASKPATDISANETDAAAKTELAIVKFPPTFQMLLRIGAQT
jgi:predicted alpha/beta hydrolase